MTYQLFAGSKLGVDATMKLPRQGYKLRWPTLIKMDEAVKAKVNALVGNGSDNQRARP
jgi:4-hydroxy-3-polyprenylbenzoate decarboxylase